APHRSGHPPVAQHEQLGARDLRRRARHLDHGGQNGRHALATRAHEPLVHVGAGVRVREVIARHRVSLPFTLAAARSARPTARGAAPCSRAPMWAGGSGARGILGGVWPCFKAASPPRVMASSPKGFPSPAPSPATTRGLDPSAATTSRKL